MVHETFAIKVPFSPIAAVNHDLVRSNSAIGKIIMTTELMTFTDSIDSVSLL
jgi:hypothetical protein